MHCVIALLAAVNVWFAMVGYGLVTERWWTDWLVLLAPLVISGLMTLILGADAGIEHFTKRYWSKSHVRSHLRQHQQRKRRTEVGES
jgi:hypothetical protein